MPSTVLLAILNITMIDLVLSGDNAVVIAMAVQHLPDGIRTRAAVVGALAAVGLRVAFAAAASLLLNIPLLQAIGGLVLFWIAFKLLNEAEEDAASPREVHGFWDAVRIIILADLVMSLDNILAVGGASHGHVSLLLFGLALSIPLVLFGSSVLANLMKKWPLLAYAGGGVLAWTAGEMLVRDKVVSRWLAPLPLGHVETWLPAVGVALVLGVSYALAKRTATARAAENEANSPTSAVSSNVKEG